ncbi:Triose-phosphate Transporter [Serendipita sp. 399]|nr:Triose-phosphate Transporter [Serendipita sp. 399]
MALTLAITSMAVEGWSRVWNDSFWEKVGILKSFVYLFSPGIVAFAMVMSEYYIISRAGVVPMSIAGIFKEVTTIIVSAWIFGDHLTELNIVGVAITIGGIALYTYHKYTAALHSAVPLDEHGNPLKEEEAEEILAIVNRSNTVDNEEGLRLLEDGGELEIPIEEVDEDEENDRTENAARLHLLERAADGEHGDGEIRKHKKGGENGDDRPLVTIAEPEEFESDTPVVAGRQEEGSREVGGVGNRVEWRR